MKKKFLAIFLSCMLLAALIVVLLPGCKPTTGTIDVKATLDGAAWTGAVQYTLTGPGAAAPTIINGTSVPTTHSRVNPGSWTCAYVSGGPGTFVNITPSVTQTVTAGGTTTFTLNFLTTGTGALDHFKGYWVEQGTSVNSDVQLEDQFGAVGATVMDPLYFCNPVKKTHDGEVTEIKDDNHHLTIYNLDHEEELQKLVVDVDNQFGKQKLHVSGPVMLAVPTKKEGHDEPVGLNHFLLYYATGPDINVVVQLEDQFHLERDVEVLRPVYFANPVKKTDATGVTEIEDDQAHLVFYQIPEELYQSDIRIQNQFDEQTLSLYGAYLLAVLSSKISFEPPPPLEHFKFYEVVNGPDADVLLPQVEDQFYTGIQEVEVQSLRYFGNPVVKTHDGTLTPIGDSDRHLALYDITTPVTQNWLVSVDNQFGRDVLTVTGPVMLAVPTWKEEHGFPAWLDHYLLYKVIEGADVQEVVDLEDQWHKESQVEVHRPVYFANPAGKASPYVDWGPGMPLIIENTEDHMVLYEIVGETFQKDVKILNQLHQQWQTISVEEAQFLAVPTEKISTEPVEPEPMLLDHFLCYWTTDVVFPGVGIQVYLEDQFVSIDAMVDLPWCFCNPTEKVHEGVVMPILDDNHHLMLYQLAQDMYTWFVGVNNQFGFQPLTVWGPSLLAVPTQKVEPGGHGPPVDLDHYLLYEVIEGPTMQVVVGVNDQFADIAEVLVVRPRYFANPVRKTDVTGMVTEIQNLRAHLVFYEILGGQYQYPQLIVINQFGEQFFNVSDPVLLAVPSEKISWEEQPLQ